MILADLLTSSDVVSGDEVVPPLGLQGKLIPIARYLDAVVPPFGLQGK